MKATSRAYVRLFEYFSSAEAWLAFLEQYRVEYVEFGTHRNGDSAVRVVDPRTGNVASLGLDIPSHMTYHTYITTARSFWNEHFLSETQHRHRTYEVGYPNPSKDELIKR